ncbi:MAG: mechanosensitive ion channel [Acidovorax sp.]|uniref:mechanosensitive ion channel family protein n=1 Tax=Acidovorax sp. TaxID=1872122 RepID=UPI0026270746|nr:mechanosensitive ion channel domain-containing protein [Acidovorax sp.]MDH4426098.1 mechanosensitive ion channel [Acidovorax sp.]
MSLSIKLPLCRGASSLWMAVVLGAIAFAAMLPARPAWAQGSEVFSGPPAASIAAVAGTSTTTAPLAGASPLTPSDDGATALWLHQRQVMTFRATLLGDTPADRARLAQAALDAALALPGDGVVTRTPLVDAVRFELHGSTLFFMVPADLSVLRAASQMDAASLNVLDKLNLAVGEYRESRDPRRTLWATLKAVGATVLAALLARLVFALRRRAVARLQSGLAQEPGGSAARRVLSTYLAHTASAIRMAASAVSWTVVVLLIDAWAIYVLHQFAYTRPWSERSTAWLLGVVKDLALGIASAVPGLLVAGLIFVMARLAARATAAVLDRVQRGEVRYAWLDVDTALPTRRLATVLIWLFALVMAYPYLPGAGSEAFKGLSVLVGLMISLGASSVVGQALSGLSLMYSRSLRVGEYIKAGDTEGTVVALGMFTTRIHTGMGEEVSVPNSVMFSQPIHNFSRLVEDGHFVLHTPVTIGYSTPWRQVHAMLLEAAARTPSVATQPPPYVVQTALSDFYVEYRLCAQSTKNAPRRRVEAMNELHANVQDVFNENGVQIMSPHYMADTAEPQVVPPGSWSPPAGRPPVQPAPAAGNATTVHLAAERPPG